VREPPRPFFQTEERPGAVQRRLLLISYHFPPGQAAGALRWQKLAPYAAERRWALDVVTLHPSGMGAPDMSRLAELPPGTRAYGIPDPMLAVERAERAIWKIYRGIRPTRSPSSPGARLASAASPDVGAARPESLGRAEIRWSFRCLALGLRRAYFSWLEYARAGRWARRAAVLALHLNESGAYQAVVTCGPPHTVHDAGRFVAHRTGLPFVMDLRDPWSLVQRLPEAIASPVWLNLATRYERRAVAAAALIVTNTEPLRLAMGAAYPAAANRIITVMNGSDDDEVVPRSCHGRRFTIAYAGTIYLDRDPRVLFAAAGHVVRMLKLGQHEFAIELMGNVDYYNGVPIQALARDAGLERFVHTRGVATRRETLDFLARATMLVSLPQDSDMAIPSKIFEYVQFDAWVLALADRGSATELVLRDSNADVVAPRDVEALTGVILERYRQYAEGCRPTRLAGSGRYSCRNQARLLFDAIERCTDGSARGLRRPRSVAVTAVRT
jgi:glycosyltransferase involved in cell wall biosynthesis